VRELQAPRESTHTLEIELELSWDTPAHYAIALSNARGETFHTRFDVTSNTLFTDHSKAGPDGFSNNFATKPSTAPRERNEKPPPPARDI
jgi:hypothetical protein